MTLSHRDGVLSRQQESVVLSVLIGPEGTKVLPPLYLHHSALSRSPVRVEHLTFNTCGITTQRESFGSSNVVPVLVCGSLWTAAE